MAGERTSLVLKVVGERAQRSAERRPDPGSLPQMPGPDAPTFPPAPPTPPVLGPLVSERLEDFSDNAAPGDQMHLPGGRIIRSRKGYVAVRHGGDQAEHESAFDAAQHLATALKLEPHVQRVERHVQRMEAHAKHREELMRHAQAAREQASMDEGVWNEVEHPRARGGKFAMRAELVARSHLMGDTEFSVKRQRYVKAGGWWPNSLADWETPKGRTLAAEIKAAKKA